VFWSGELGLCVSANNGAIRLLAQYVDMYEQGRLHAPDPVSYFDASNVEQAFRYLQNGAHIGKVVVTMPDDATQINSLPLSRSLTLDADATYLLVGGAKGLGSSVATWLVERGAKSLTFLSRSSGVSADSIALFEELRAMGCSVNALKGSVEVKEDVEAAISSSGKPVKGVFQLAMVLNVSLPSSCSIIGKGRLTCPSGCSSSGHEVVRVEGDSWAQSPRDLEPTRSPCRPASRLLLDGQLHSERH
jgi:hypothetical protein